eukprot:364815-Chlamydomonas_euryale.AAC.9
MHRFSLLLMYNERVQAKPPRPGNCASLTWRWRRSLGAKPAQRFFQGFVFWPACAQCSDQRWCMFSPWLSTSSAIKSDLLLPVQVLGLASEGQKHTDFVVLWNITHKGLRVAGICGEAPPAQENGDTRRQSGLKRCISAR